MQGSSRNLVLLLDFRACLSKWGKRSGEIMLFLLLLFHISDVKFLFQYLDLLVEVLLC